jgi:hypothetical protein
VIAVLVLLSGCVASHPLVISEPIGPAQAVLHKEHQTGELIVYSSWTRFDTLDSEHRKHSPYLVEQQGGTNIVRVNNRRGTFGEEPEAVPLAPGHYLVKARATNVGRVEVPVIIREGETTVVYLDGITAPSAIGQQDTNWVRQPNGRIVGWGDTASAK